MEKINIAELLRDCPQGMELDCTLFGGLEFDGIVDNEYLPIRCRIKNPCGGYNVCNFTKYGCWLDTTFAKCIIFPKGKTTWEGFVPPCKFKEGDIISNDMYIAIFYKADRPYTDFKRDVLYYHCWYNRKYNEFKVETDYGIGHIEGYKLATEEEKQKLFDAIKANGYHWNAETKTLEKLFPYKIGTKIWIKSDKEPKYIHTIVGISRNSFGNLEYEVKEEKTGIVVHYPTDLLIPVTEEKPRFKEGDVIINIYRKHLNGDSRSGKIYQITNDKYIFTDGSFIYIQDQNNWVLNTTKFDITTLKPFDNCKYSIDGGKTWKFAQYWYVQDKYDVNEIEIDLWLN